MARVVRSSSQARARSGTGSSLVLGSTDSEPMARAASTMRRAISAPPEDVDRARRAAAAHVVRERDLGAAHLPRAGVPLELLERLDGLSRAGGAQGVALGLEAAAGVDRDIVRLPREAAPLALGAEAQVLRREHLRDGEAV